MEEIIKYENLIEEVKSVLISARKRVVSNVNYEIIMTYWNIGKLIVKYEQNDQLRAEYGKNTLKALSKVLTQESGKGFSRSNLQNMRAFYANYENCQTLSGKLSWSH